MTTTTLTTNQRLTVVKHLASGKSLDVVAAITSLDRATVVDIGNHHGYPDKGKLAWAADILAKKAAEAAAPKADRPDLEHATHAAPRPTTSVSAPSRPAAVPSTPTPAAGPGPHHELIHTGLSHPGKRIQAAAQKVLDDLDRLRTLLAEDEQKHAARRKAEQEKAKARAEVERLEQQLAEAKAKLRGGKDPAKKPRPAKAPKVRGPLDFACRNDGCDKAYDTAQGRSMHERLRCEHRDQAAS